MIPVEQAFARIFSALLISIIFLLCLLTARPYRNRVDERLAAACASTLVFIFLGAMLVRIYEQIATESGPAAATEMLVFTGTHTLTGVLIGLCIFALAISVALTVHLAHCHRKERLNAAKWATQTIDPPVFDWRPTRYYAAFLSQEHQVESVATLPWARSIVVGSIRCELSQWWCQADCVPNFKPQALQA